MSEQNKTQESLSKCRNELSDIRKGMVEEFAEIERKLSEKFKDSGMQNISPDEFLQLKKKRTLATQIITELEKQGKHQAGLHNALLIEFATLNDLWLEEFNLIKNELDKVDFLTLFIKLLFSLTELSFIFISIGLESFNLGFLILYYLVSVNCLCFP
ncbi:MAG: hypothetical protein HQK65_06840 [Desulfamplus sp.]|nr:hypothetical protein [Desulfamplus sp.]